VHDLPDVLDQDGHALALALACIKRLQQSSWLGEFVSTEPADHILQIVRKSTSQARNSRWNCTTG